MAKEVKANFVKGAIADAIAKDVDAQIAHANSTLATWRNYIKLCAEGHMQPTDARGLLTAINARLKVMREKNHDTRPIAPLQDSRVSEAKSILMLSTMKCWPAVLDMLKGLDVQSGGRGVNAGTLLAVSKFVRSRGEGRDKLNWDKNVATAPPRERIMRAIDVRRKKRRGNGETDPNVATVRNPENNLDVIARNARGLAKWFGKDKGRAFIDAIAKAVASAKPEVKRLAKARKAEAEAA